MTDNEINKALFILRHGSAEGEHKYLEAIEIIKSAYNRQQALIDGFRESNREYAEMLYEQTAEIKKKDTEIDILIRKNERLKDEISELQYEIAELKAELKGGAE